MPGSSAEGTAHTVSGDLTIRGQTKRVTSPTKVEVGASGAKAAAEFTLNRQDFGLSYKGKADDLIQDSVVRTVDLWRLRRRAADLQL